MSGTRYARNGEVSIAYAVIGQGPIDLVYVPGFVSHVEIFQEQPSIAAHIRRLASFSRLVLFDKRGTGMSDPSDKAPTLDERMDDIRAVTDAAGVERSAVFGMSEGGPLALLYAATYPERVSALVLYASGARFTSTDGYPHGVPTDIALAFIQHTQDTWGQPSRDAVAIAAPSKVDDPAFVDEWGRARRMAASPRMAADLLRMNVQIDVRALLPTITVPTLILHRSGDRFIDVSHGRYLAEHIPSARLVELPGDDHVPWVGADDLHEEIETFLTGTRTSPSGDRALATVLFTDIVGSTSRAAAVGDAAWRTLLDGHYTITQRTVERFGGRTVKSTGDGFLATFDRPGRAIEAAKAISAAARDTMDLEVRCGLHAGEVEIRGDDISGIAVNLARRICDAAPGPRIYVSQTVTDLVFGSALTFAARGSHELKGIPGAWALYEVETADPASA